MAISCGNHSKDISAYCLRFIKPFHFRLQFIRFGWVVDAKQQNGCCYNLFDDGCSSIFAISISRTSSTDIKKNVLCQRIIPMLIRNKIFSPHPNAVTICHCVAMEKSEGKRREKNYSRGASNNLRRATLNLFIYLASSLLIYCGIENWMDNMPIRGDQGQRHQQQKKKFIIISCW